MDYPNDFNIKSFPAGKTIAFSRSVSTWILIVFFFIIAMCGFVLLGVHLKRNYPFLISIDPFTDEWSVITYPGKDKKESVQQYQIMQEKLVRDFVTNWFTISGNADENEKRWQDCDIEECATDTQFKPGNIQCAISCKSNEDVFENFSKNVLPEYRTYASSAGKWTVGPKLITPTTNPVGQTHSTWQVVTTIYPAMSAPFNVLTFITIKQDQSKYPATLGYHITQFNSYRIPNE